MKKIQIFLLLGIITFMYACQQNKKTDSLNNTEVADEILLEENSHEEERIKNVEELKDIDESSIKYRLLGMWQDINDSTYKMEITPTKYKNYLEGDINWNQDWKLANTSDSYLGNLDDNGMFIWAFDDDNEDLYCCEIKTINESTLEVEHVFGGLSGNHEKFERVN
jgi:hypothetical protein